MVYDLICHFGTAPDYDGVLFHFETVQLTRNHPPRLHAHMACSCDIVTTVLRCAAILFAQCNFGGTNWRYGRSWCREYECMLWLLRICSWHILLLSCSVCCCFSMAWHGIAVCWDVQSAVDCSLCVDMLLLNGKHVAFEFVAWHQVLICCGMTGVYSHAVGCHCRRGL